MHGSCYELSQIQFGNRQRLNNKQTNTSNLDKAGLVFGSRIGLHLESGLYQMPKGHIA